jgi:hypothetical protein
LVEEEIEHENEDENESDWENWKARMKAITTTIGEPESEYED